MRYECGGCGHGLAEGARFCGGCGRPVVDAAGDHANRSPLARRAASWAVDLVVIMVIWGLVAGVVDSVLPSDGQGGGPAGNAHGLNLFLLPAAYLIVFEALWGRTLGKLAFRLRVGALDGRPRLGWRTAAARHVGRLLSLIPLAGGYLAACGPSRRAWHDTFSGTVVIDAGASVIVEAAPPPATASALIRPVVVAEPAPVPVRAAVPMPPPPPQPDRDPAAPPRPAVRSADLRAMSSALARRGHADEAADTLIEALRTEGSTESAEWCEAALLLVDVARGAEALTVVNEVLLRHPGHARAEAIRSLALAMVGPNTADDELASAEAACHHDPTDPLAVVAKAFALHHQHRDGEAEALLDGAAAVLGAEAGRAALCRLSIANRRNDAEAARRWAAVAAEHNPHNAYDAVRVARTLDGRPGPRSKKTVPLLWWSVRGWATARFGVPRNLTAQTDILVDGLTAEPQNHAIREELRTIPTIGEREPRGHLLVVALPWGLLGTLFPLSLLLTRPVIGAAATAIALAVGGLHLRAYRAQYRLLSPAARSWLVYVRQLEKVRSAQKRQASSSRPVTVPPIPDPPTGSPMAAPSRCVCDVLNVVYGDTAINYARLHLVERSSHGGRVFELTCPTTLTPWLALETTDQRPVRLCRLAEQLPAPASAPDPQDLPGQYL